MRGNVQKGAKRVPTRLVEMLSPANAKWETQQQLDPPETSGPTGARKWDRVDDFGKDLVFLVISGSVLKPIRCKHQWGIINYAELGEIKEDGRVEEKGKKKGADED